MAEKECHELPFPTLAIPKNQQFFLIVSMYAEGMTYVSARLLFL
jgi:hypothetical protein